MAKSLKNGMTRHSNKKTFTLHSILTSPYFTVIFAMTDFEGLVD